MAARRSRTRLACAKEPPASYISLIFAIPTATNCARFIACRLPELLQIKPEEGRPFRAVPARERTWLGPIGRAPHELTFGPSRERSGGGRRLPASAAASAVLEPIAEPNRAALQHLGARQGHRGDRCRYAGILVAGRRPSEGRRARPGTGRGRARRRP